ncbi:hypothetical protein GWI72_06550 [Microvirga tunisiensis]|uniref:DUF945 domain-containing protein n=1 Tax=Pannonibacter tanglangensis TaxID=2750084 RepID=A0A7X5J7W3_9HYPH|nr:hypothetical protein [Pannonibacter sp. XCT-53]NBN77927.1 hypothetical protein [Pannonibacter sp. XCT-53]
MLARPLPLPLRRRSLRLALVAGVMSLPLPAHAETAADLAREWNEQYLAWGATVARYGRVEPGLSERDVTLHDGEITFSLPLPTDSGHEVEVRVTYDTATLTGVERTAKGYSAESIRIPGDLTFEVTLPADMFDTTPAPDSADAANEDATTDGDGEGAETDTGSGSQTESETESETRAPSGVPSGTPSPDTRADAGAADALDADALQDMTLVVVQRNTVAENLAWPAFPPLPNDPQKPVTQYLPLAKLLLDFETDRLSVDTLSATQTNVDGSESSTVYQTYILRNQANGRIEETSIEKTVQTEVMPSLTGDGLETIEVTVGRQVTRGADVMPLLSLLGQGTDPNRKTLIAEQDAADIRIKGKSFEVAVASIRGADIGVSNTAALRVLPMLDQVTLDETAVSDEDLGRAMLEAIGLFEIGTGEINGITLTATDAGGSVQRVVVRQASTAGLGEFSINGLTGEVKNEGKLTFDRVAVSDLEFPSLSTLMQIGLSGEEPDVLQTLAARPIIGLFEIIGLTLDAPTLGGLVTVDEYRQAERGHINRIPTDIGLSMRGVRFPLSLVEDPDAYAILSSLNLKEVVIDQNLKATWNETTGDLALEDLSFTMKDGGSFKMSFVLGSVPRTLFETPEMAQVALASATVKSAMVRSSDAKIVRAFLEKQAKDANLSADTLAMGLADTAANDMGPLAATRFGEELIQALRAFLIDPKEIVIEIAPENPVPVTQLIGMVATSPNSIPDVLNARVRSK